ncbi:4550_t:CDS:2 [Gigaspora rosea]|nr:4550_t:CDS:2 [Gigaspora rosea]
MATRNSHSIVQVQLSNLLVDGAPIKDPTYTHFYFMSGFNTLTLAYMLDSLVHVSRQHAIRNPIPIRDQAASPKRYPLQSLIPDITSTKGYNTPEGATFPQSFYDIQNQREIYHPFRAAFPNNSTLRNVLNNIPTDLVQPGMSKLYLQITTRSRNQSWVLNTRGIKIPYFFNDPSARLPTETLLRLLLPLNDQV